jgi:hypothetical protein
VVGFCRGVGDSRLGGRSRFALEYPVRMAAYLHRRPAALLPGEGYRGNVGPTWFVDATL